jgi:hypothetical protein
VVAVAELVLEQEEVVVPVVAALVDQVQIAE